MKKLITLCLILCGLVSVAQPPRFSPHTTSSPTTVEVFKGAVKAEKGFINAEYPDTTTANSNSISKHNGSQIKVGSDIYLRDSVNNKWVKIGSGGGDTTSLSARIDTKLNKVDTAAMLTNYKHWIQGYLKAADITGKINASDTAAMLTNYKHWLQGYLKVADIAGKVNASDTAAMLTNYKHWLQGYLKAADIVGKVNYTDTAAMLTAARTYAALVAHDSALKIINDSLKNVYLRNSIGSFRTYYKKNDSTGVFAALLEGLGVKLVYSLDANSDTVITFKVDTSSVPMKAWIRAIIGDTSAVLRGLIASGGGGPGSLTPWPSDIVGAQHSLSDVKSIEINIKTTAGTSVGTIWNSSDKVHVNLTGSDKVATQDGNNGGVRSVLGISSGKWYWEYKLTAYDNQNAFFGISTAAANLSSPPADPAAFGLWGASKDKVTNSNYQSYGSGNIALNDIVGIKYDATNRTLEILVNNISLGVAYTSSDIPADTYYATVGNASNLNGITAHFDAADLVYAAPVGYNAGLYSTVGGSPDTLDILHTDSVTGIIYTPNLPTTPYDSAAFKLDVVDDVSGAHYKSAWPNIGNLGGWGLAGNAGTTPGTHFIGTTDAQDMVLKVNNTQFMRAVAAANSLAVGIGATVSGGNYATAFGTSAEATGDYSVAVGNSAKATANSAVAIGPSSEATNNSAVALGVFAKATGYYSLATGFATKAKSYGGAVMGIFNDTTNATSATSWDAANRLWQLGNGTADIARSNAVTVLFNGNFGINTMTPTEKLDVAGNVKFSGALMPNNTAGVSGQILQSNGAGASPTYIDNKGTFQQALAVAALRLF